MAFQDQFSYHGPTRLLMGQGSINSVPELLSENQLKKTLIVTDPGLIKANKVKKITDILDLKHQPYVIYDQVQPNPPIKNVQECADLYIGEKCDHMITVGGGSPMDTAKCAGVIINNGGHISEYFIGSAKVVSHRIPFLICIPTTYGTASEVTPFAVITNGNFKSTVAGPNIIPHIGIIDPDISVDLPLSIAAATGMDTLT
ncbi:MAG: iron-containing alcohol dehydrogenase, partial [Candidatus Latescibacteria bacterium]|nr:iron-containing alcohol dehydrogenase [Candidatus Latescibacterota bacterium]